ncbi:MAG: hypothetical protein L3J96_04670, partial [Thermoplasmata archaeon]|nr:hypothetical protein [Thermoplasmata archaeon]
TGWLRGKWLGGVVVWAAMAVFAAVTFYSALVGNPGGDFTVHTAYGLGLAAFFAGSSILLYLANIQVARPAREVCVSQEGLEIRYPTRGSILLRWSDPSFALQLAGFPSSALRSVTYVSQVGWLKPRLYSSADAARVITAAARQAGLDVSTPQGEVFDFTTTVRIRARRSAPPTVPK